MINFNALEDLYESIRTDPFYNHLRQNGVERLVPGEGDNPIAFIIGEAPGAVESAKGRPFIGPSGRVLRQLMAVAGLQAEPRPVSVPKPNCWLTNVVKYRPSGNRTPTQSEITHSRKYLNQEWHAVGRPDLIIPVGAPALSCVLGRIVGITRYAGKPIYRKTRPTLSNPFSQKVTIWPMFHPAFALRNEAIRPTVEMHWQELGEWLKEKKK